MELRHLQYFIAVAEELHFGKAALRLNMTQPPLSQQIKQLEKEVGVTLLKRTKRVVELSAAGESFLKHSRNAIEEIDKAIEMAQRTARGELGRLVVGFVGSPHMNFCRRSFGNSAKNSPPSSLICVKFLLSDSRKNF